MDNNLNDNQTEDSTLKNDSHTSPTEDFISNDVISNDDTFMTEDTHINNDDTSTDTPIETSIDGSASVNNATFINKISAIKYIFKDIEVLDVIVRLFSSYFIVMLYKTARIEEKFSNLEFGTNIVMSSFILQIILMFLILSVVQVLVKDGLKSTLKTDGYFLGTSVMLYGAYTVFRLNNFYYALGVCLVIATIMIFLVHNRYFKEFETLSKRQAKVIVGIFFLCFVVFVGTFCMYRYITYATSCYDFGIFCQMFYYMVHHGLSADTTCERNYLLSHFAVHFSPIYYILVPIYAIFQSPKTLLICQVIIVASGVIPLYLICKNFKFSNATTVGLCAMLIFSPALISSTFYDFHENKFLVPLILWLFWAIETGHIKLMYVFMALVLLVKEDAFIYVASISLFLMFSKKTFYNKKKDKEQLLLVHGIIMLVISLVYFLVVSKLMEKYGLGIMEYRYNNIMMEQDAGLINVIKTIALNPAIAIYEAFTEDKILFFLQMTVPLLFLPFFNKKISHVFLLIPFFMVNLISDYAYQTQIGYQYVCGVMSMLIYLSILNLHELKMTPKRYVSSVCMCTSMIMGFMYFSEKFSYYDSLCNNNGRVMRMNQLISLIPEDASVEATTYFVPQLSQRDEVYIMKGAEPSYDPTDFIVLKVGAGEESFVEDKINWATDNGYEFYNGYSDIMYLFVKSEYIEEHPELKENQRLEPIIWQD